MVYMPNNLNPDGSKYLLVTTLRAGSINVIKMKLMAIFIQALIHLKIKPEIIQTLMSMENNLEKNIVKILSVKFKNL